MLSTQTLTLLAFAAVSLAETTNPWATYPEVPKTASINGFADPIYDVIPECAKACVAEDTGSTPCPYWDTGCLCVMSNWSGAVAQCVAESCQGENVEVFTSVATSKCDEVGVPSPYWFIPDSAAAALSDAADAEANTTTDEDTTTSSPTTSSTSTTAPDTTSTTPEETTSSSPAPETTSSAPAPETTSSAPAPAEDTTTSSAPAPAEDTTTSSAPAPAEDTTTSSAPAPAENTSSAPAPAEDDAEESSTAEETAAPSVEVQTNGAAIKGASVLAGAAAFFALL